MKNAVFWDITTCGCCKNRGDNIAFLRSVFRLPVNSNVVPSSPTLITLIMEVIHSSETSGLVRTTRCNIPEIGILHSLCRKNFRSCKKTSSFRNVAFFST
jgi:hypothetical protein